MGSGHGARERTLSEESGAQEKGAACARKKRNGNGDKE
jgi:hypothetical protein